MPFPNIPQMITLTVLEANIDDMNPELFPHVIDGLLAAGARDAWVTPIIMKRGRPAHMLSALCDPDLKGQLVGVILRETTTLGVRSYGVERFELARETIQVATEIGQVEVKLGLDATGSVVQRSPEHRSCVAAAQRSGRPLREVYQLALAAALQGGGR